MQNVFEPSLSYRYRPHNSRRRRQWHPIGQFFGCALGLLTAYWLAARVLPRVEIHEDAGGSWTRVEIDWTRTMLGNER